MQFREAVVETEFTVLEPVIAFVASLISQSPHLPRNSGIAGDNHPPFSGRYLLVGVESKNSCISQCADLLSLKLGPNCFACIFNQKQTMTPCNREECIHIRRMSERVNGNDCLRFVRDRSFCLLWIHVESERININKDGICSNVANGVGCRDEGERRHNHFILRPYAESMHAQVKGGSPGAYANGVRSTRINGNGALKFFEFGAHTQARTVQHLHHSVYFCRRYVRCREWNLHVDDSGMDARFHSRSASSGREVNIS